MLLMGKEPTYSTVIAVMGLGYVGLPLALTFSKQYAVVGYDIDPERINALCRGIDHTGEADVSLLVGNEQLLLTSDAAQLKGANVYIVTVPTPIDIYKAPDLGPLLSATRMVASVLKKGDLVIYESTVYPGCTEEDCVPVLEQVSGLVFNRDFFCGYSPERINPGDKVNTLTTIKKITSGSTPQAAAQVDALYQSIITAGTYPAPSIKVAEAAKAIENAQRDVNISFVNELALIFDRMHIDTRQVLEAAASKWNFLPFSPGLVGGHCIGVDPYYLAHKAKLLGYHPQVILSGRQVNDTMAHFVATKLVKLLIAKDNRIKGARVLLLGVSFKENCPDTRNTKVPDIADALHDFGLQVDLYDPIANLGSVLDQRPVRVIDAITDTYDAIVLAVPHTAFLQMNLPALKKNDQSVLFDVKGALNQEWVDARL